MYYTSINICPSSLAYFLSGQFYTEVRSVADTYGIRSLVELSRILRSRLGVDVCVTDILRSLDIHTDGKYFTPVENTSTYDKVIGPMLTRDVVRAIYKWLCREDRTTSLHTTLRTQERAYKAFINSPRVTRSFDSSDKLSELKPIFEATYKYCIDNDLINFGRYKGT